MESIWSQSCQIRERAPLQGNTKSEIAVIGAGMAGVLIASALQAAGCQVILLEADRIGGGQTRNTTAKMTSQHGMIFQKLIRTVGEDRARQYAEANEAAVREYQKLITDQGIDCELESCSAYVYGADEKSLRTEVNAARKLGLPAEFVNTIPLPVPCAGAVKFSHQAQFHPLKFLKAVSDKLTVYEHTPVYAVHGNRIVTEHGTVQAEQIVFACHYPFVNVPGLYFARMHQERSYVLALKNASQVDGMFIGTGKEQYSFRNAGELLLLGGQGHRTGENAAGQRYDRLRQKAREWFPGSEEVACWSAQDCITPDGVPYIGRYSARKPNWYVATGFQKWGMTSSMVSAMLLRDMICGEAPSYAKVFDPGRWNKAMIWGIASESGHAVKNLTKRLVSIPTSDAEQLPAGHGGVVRLHGKKAGVYKEPDGTLHVVNIRCPHLGCQLQWNPDERSWDCPCHGSRFDYEGNPIAGPAQKGIRRE